MYYGYSDYTIRGRLHAIIQGPFEPHLQFPIVLPSALPSALQGSMKQHHHPGYEWMWYRCVRRQMPWRLCFYPN